MSAIQFTEAQAMAMGKIRAKAAKDGVNLSKMWKLGVTAYAESKNGYAPRVRFDIYNEETNTTVSVQGNLAATADAKADAEMWIKFCTVENWTVQLTNLGGTFGFAVDFPTSYLNLVPAKTNTSVYAVRQASETDAIGQISLRPGKFLQIEDTTAKYTDFSFSSFILRRYDEHVSKLEASSLTPGATYVFTGLRKATSKRMDGKQVFTIGGYFKVMPLEEAMLLDACLDFTEQQPMVVKSDVKRLREDDLL